MSQNPTTTPETIAIRAMPGEFTVTCPENGDPRGVIAIPPDSAAPISPKARICDAIAGAAVVSDAPSNFNCTLQDGTAAEARLQFTTSVAGMGEICIAVSVPEAPKDDSIGTAEIGGGVLLGLVLAVAAVKSRAR